MAFAIFSDIHGNLEALDAILKHVAKNRKIKQKYFLGDAITFGPDSSACLKLLKKHKVKCVVGNHEQRVVRYDNAVKTMTYATPEHIRYVFSTLDNDDLRFIKSMPVEIKINYKGFNILFAHYSHNENGVVRDDYDELTETRLVKLFGEKNCDVVFFGHVHQRKLIVNESGRSYVCVGASGCVKGDKTFYTYFDVRSDMGEDFNFDIYRVNIKYNRKKFEQRMHDEPLPDKENYAKYTFGIQFKEEEDNT